MGRREADVEPGRGLLTHGEPGGRPDRVDASLASTRLRLAGVYAFRPSRPGLSDELLEDAASVAVGAG